MQPYLWSMDGSLTSHRPYRILSWIVAPYLSPFYRPSTCQKWLVTYNRFIRQWSVTHVLISQDIWVDKGSGESLSPTCCKSWINGWFQDIYDDDFTLHREQWANALSADQLIICCKILLPLGPLSSQSASWCISACRISSDSNDFTCIELTTWSCDYYIQRLSRSKTSMVSSPIMRSFRIDGWAGIVAAGYRRPWKCENQTRLWEGPKCC